MRKNNKNESILYDVNIYILYIRIYAILLGRKSNSL